MSATATKPFRIGMLGAGTVGGGVYELVMKQAFPSIVISKICVRSLDKPRDFAIDAAHTSLTTDPNELLADEIDCVVEVAGGCGVAKDLVLDALQKKAKVVVTANKALLAEHLSTIEAAAAVANTPLGYEAAVCGGIPIISALSTAYTGDAIQSVAGICNGTTNFMLSAMAKDDTIQYADILKQAQDLGYAEADPTADVEGHDVRAKIAILAKLAFGTTVSVDDIPCAGITKITSADFAYAKDKLSCTIKLVGTAADDNGELSVYVTPALVPFTHMLASIDGSGNCVSVTSANMGTCSFTGPGAGRFPTANSVVADIYRAAEKSLPATAFPVPRSCANKTFTLNPDYTSDFYVRIPTNDTSSISEKIVALGREMGLEVPALSVEGACALAVIPSAKKSAVEKFCSAVEQHVGSAPLFMPIMQ